MNFRLEEIDEAIEKLQGEKRVIAWGSQISFYVMHPYRWSRTIAQA
jgi:protein subunit release factor B